MGSRLLALAAAAAAGFVALPALSQDFERPATTTFFVSIPLDSRTAPPSFGVQFQGSRPYQFVKFDYQALRALPAALTAIEAKYRNFEQPQARPAQACAADCATQK
ncbi:MAG TPA: hypothetical protein VNU64_08805 [Burkholderiales bacterium]|nr:hypothetical protein [Burkholderiales bacterium]